MNDIKTYIYRFFSCVLFCSAYVVAAAQYGAYEPGHAYLGISSFETNANCDGEGSLGALSDGNPDTYWHSYYKTSQDAPGKSPQYLQANLENDKFHGYVYLHMKRRMWHDGHPTQFLVQGRDVNGEWRSIARWFAPYDGVQGSWVRSGAMYIPFECSALRFWLENSTGNNYGDLYMHMAEFKIEDLARNSDEYNDEPYDLKLKDFSVVSRPGILDPRNRAWDPDLQNWCDWDACWDADGKWKKDLDKLNEAGVYIPDIQLLTNDIDPRINPGVRHQRVHTEEHIVYAVPGDVVRLAPYVTFANTSSYHQRYLRWYDYKTGKLPEHLNFHNQSYGVYKTLSGYMAGNDLVHWATHQNTAGIGDYQIATADDFVNFVNNCNSGKPANAVFVSDIDMTGRTVEPIERYSGYIRGNGHAIINLTINKPGENLVGMFRRITGYTEIYDLRLVNANITGETYVGGFVGAVEKGSEGFEVWLRGLSFEGTVTGNQNVAGIIGCNGSDVGVKVIDCCVAGNINGKMESAAISGWLCSGGSGSLISCCYSTATVHGVDGTRRFYRAAGNPPVENCYGIDEADGSGVTRLSRVNETYQAADGLWFDSPAFLDRLQNGGTNGHFSNWRWDCTNPASRRPVPDSQGKNGISWGAMATFCIPSETGLFDDEYISCDIAQHYERGDNFYDSEGVGNTIVGPVLSLRHLFIIKDGRPLADEITDDNAGYINRTRRYASSIAGKDFQVRLEVRVPVQQNAPSDLYYRDARGIYRRMFSYDIETVDESTGQSVPGMFRFGEEAYYYGRYRRDNIMQLDCQALNGHSYYRMLMCDADKAKVGRYRVKFYAKDQNGNVITLSDGKKLEVAEWYITFKPATSASMHSEQEYASEAFAAMHPDNLTERFGEPLDIIDFDEYRKLEFNLDANGSNDYICSGTVDGENNTKADSSGPNIYGAKMFRWNHSWAGSSYGFNYNRREDYAMYVVANHSNAVPYHGAADNHDNGPGQPKGLYDRLYYDTGGKEKGYYYYVNAAADPGQMALLYIPTLCAGTTLHVSAWVAEFSPAEEVANLVIKFNARLKDGSDVTLNRFVTGYVPREKVGDWMHVYYNFVPSLGLLDATESEIETYYLSLENNCKSSSGADYAIDDIRVWAARPEVGAEQTRPICMGETKSEVRVELTYDALLASVGLQRATGDNAGTDVDLFFTFLDRQVYEETLGQNPQDGAYALAFNAAQITRGDGTEKVGHFVFSSKFEDLPDYDAAQDRSGPCRAVNMYGDDIIAFDTYPNDSRIRAGREYILALYVQEKGGESQVTAPDAHDFDVESECARIGYFTLHSSGVVKIDGVVVPDMDNIVCCINQSPVVQIDLWGKSKSSDELMEVEKNSCFDWYGGSMNDFVGERFADEDKSLAEVLDIFRQVYPDATTWDCPAKGLYTEGMRQYLHSLAVSGDGAGDGKLKFYRSSYVFPPLSGIMGQDIRCYVVAIPIERNTEDYIICSSPAEVCINVREHAPQMLHGLTLPASHPYPASMWDVPLRLGLKQLMRASAAPSEVKTHPYMLNVPLRYVHPSTGGVTELTMTDDTFLYLAETDDPAFRGLDIGASDDPDYGLVQDLTPQGEIREIVAVEGGRRNMLRVVFYNKFMFREGHFYRFKLHFMEKGPQEQPCMGDLVFTLKVVPEFQQWIGDADSNPNWNNDRNWRRVNSGELYIDNPGERMDRFVTDGENSWSGSYVPLDFSKVMIAGSLKYPHLYNMETVEINADINGSDMKFLWPFDTSSDEDAGSATEGIQYDMASFELNGVDGVWCRPWYAHTCEQIHFRPNSEIMNQQYLTYNRAWVEMEMRPDFWYTLASPLKETLAGDMYLPSDNARQETELFQPVVFNTSVNNRFNPAVYQRAWNKAVATVFEKNGNNRNVAITSTWSHVYNDVTVNYNAGTGFSIKTEPESDAVGQVLFRLPKDDAEYWYYENGSNVGGNHTSVNRSGDNGRLNDVNTSVSVDADAESRYFLVGNPFMAHLDMAEFLKENSGLIYPKYWLLNSEKQASALWDEYGGGFISAEAGAEIAPLQGFFVEARNPGRSLKLNFNSHMICVKPYDSNTGGNLLHSPAEVLTQARSGAGCHALAITAMRDGVPATHALVRVCPTASDMYDGEEDVALILDPNQSQLPKVYTVAGNVAAAINTVPELEMTEIGLAADDDETTVLRFSNTGCVDGVMLYDATTGEMSQLYDGMEYSVEGSSAGRLFLTSGMTRDMAAGLCVDVSGCTVTVTSPSGCGNLSVDVCDTMGRLVTSRSSHDNVISVNLASGVYMVRAENSKSAIVKKIIIW